MRSDKRGRETDCAGQGQAKDNRRHGGSEVERRGEAVDCAKVQLRLSRVQRCKGGRGGAARDRGRGGW